MMLLLTLFLNLTMHAGELSGKLPPVTTAPQEFGAGDLDLRIAPPDIDAHYRTILSRLFDLARKGGFPEQIGWFRLRRFREETASVALWINASRTAVVGSGQRTGSVFFTAQKAIVLNLGLLHEVTRDRRNWDPINVGFETLVIHEFMGALGYPDENYELSTVLWMRTEPADFSAVLPAVEAALRDHLADHPRLTTNIVSTAGGSTGFGGGGDPASAMIKNHALGNLARNFESWSKALGLSAAERDSLPSWIIRARLEPLSESYAETENPPRSSEAIGIAGAPGERYLTIDTAGLLAARTDEAIGMISYAFIRELVRLRRNVER